MKVSLELELSYEPLPNWIPNRNANRTPSFYSLFNPFQIPRDVFFREAQRSTGAITGQPLTSNLAHHCRAGDAATKLPDILDGVLRSLALQRRASYHLLRYLLFHTSLACEYHESLSTLGHSYFVYDSSMATSVPRIWLRANYRSQDGICLAQRCAVRMYGYT